MREGPYGLFKVCKGTEPAVSQKEIKIPSAYRKAFCSWDQASDQSAPGTRVFGTSAPDWTPSSQSGWPESSFCWPRLTHDVAYTSNTAKNQTETKQQNKTLPFQSDF